ncbi:MAG: class I SAM-dependent methyltransferase [Pseudomonadota bacterium]
MARMSATTLQSECHGDEVALLRRILVGHDLPGRHLEIGTAAGGTLKELMLTYPDAATRPDFVVIDPMTYFDDQLSKVRHNLAASGIDPDAVTFWTGTSEDFLAAERRSGGVFDFIFVDGDHRAAPVMVDMQWADMLRDGGFICFHDRSESFPGVGWSIAHFLRQNPNFHEFDSARTLVVLRKTGEGRRPVVTRADLKAARLEQHRLRLRRSLRKRLPFLFARD